MEVRSTETQGGEVPHNLPPALLPAISYSEALRSRFTLDRITYTIRDCPDYVFKSFIERCGQEALGNSKWAHLQQTNLLVMLDTDCSDIARWYAVELLLEHKVAVPLH